MPDEFSRLQKLISEMSGDLGAPATVRMLENVLYNLHTYAGRREHIDQEAIEQFLRTGLEMEGFR